MAWDRLSMILLLLLAAFSCKKEDVIIEPDPVPEPVPQLRSVKVHSESVIVEERNTAEFTFSVEDSDFSFDLSKDVVLYNTSLVTPEEYSIIEVRRGASPGEYVAVLKDNGLGNLHSIYVRVAVKQDPVKNTYVISNTFRIEGKETETHGIVLDTGLPVVFIDTENRARIVSKINYLSASLMIREAGEEYNLDKVTCSVRGRGNTTWSWPKKPYLVKLDSKASLFGMPKHKRWILLANFMDRTLMRNLVAMKVSSMTSLDWTPRCIPVELVLNGMHQGTYLLIEQVKVDKNRVKISEMTPQDNSGDALTGGYILECDFHYDNEVQWMDPHGKCVQFEQGIPFGVKYPDPEDLTQEQLTYIKDYIYTTGEALYGPDFTDPEKGYSAYIDVDSFIDYWIVFEVMGNHELGNPGSVYFHKDRNGKLKAGPCWDFDWGILSYYTSPQAKTGLVNGSAIWYDRLFQDPSFKEKVKARYQELLPQLQTIPDYIDQTEQLLTQSAALNFSMWNPAEDASMNGGQIINGDEKLTFHSAVSRLKANYQERLVVIPKSL